MGAQNLKYMFLTVSAPGKVHLLGEHAVVYGRPALIAAINYRLYVSIQFQQDKKFIIKTSEREDLAREAIAEFKKAFPKTKLPYFQLIIRSEIPVGSGLGSSAALAAGIIGVLLKSVKHIWDPVFINELVYKVEKIAHGNPSGADNTAVVFGGLVWFRKEFDFLKSIWNLPIQKYKIPRFVMIDSGRPEETTKEMVFQVADLYKKNKGMMEEIFSDQERQTKQLLLSLRRGDKKELIVSLRSGERNLEKMGVVGSFAFKVIREIEEIGGAAKICGAGGKKKGSGVLLCYHHQPQRLIAVAKKLNLPAFFIELGGEGVRIEKGKVKQ